MAETKKKAAAPAGESKSKAASSKITESAPVGNAGGFRAIAIVLWLLAIGCEVLAILILSGILYVGKGNKSLVFAILAIVADLIFVIAGSLCWKKANRIKPASKKKPVLFWLWNNMGLIVCCIAFLPFIILALKNDKIDKKAKIIAAVAGIIALAIGGLASYDWNPISIEEKDAATAILQGEVYWAPFGRVYHVYKDCNHISHLEDPASGSVTEAIEANRTRLCSTCANRYKTEHPDAKLDDLLIDGKTDSSTE